MLTDTFHIDGVKITFLDVDDATRDEAANYLAFVREHVDNPVHSITVTADANGEEVNIAYTAHGQKFERIRRVTGYLVGTLDRWNDSKQAEERDRVKHVRS